MVRIAGLASGQRADALNHLGRAAPGQSYAGGTIIHNYGHGGAGVTLSWGCAAEVVERVGALA